MPIDGGLFSFVLNLTVFTALISLAAFLEILSVSLNFSSVIVLIITTFDLCVCCR